MTENKIGDEGAKALSEMLRVNTTLKSFNLGCEKDEFTGKRIVPTSPFGDCVVGTLSVGMLAEAHIIDCEKIKEREKNDD